MMRGGWNSSCHLRVFSRSWDSSRQLQLQFSDRTIDWAIPHWQSRKADQCPGVTSDLSMVRINIPLSTVRSQEVLRMFKGVPTPSSSSFQSSASSSLHERLSPISLSPISLAHSHGESSFIISIFSIMSTSPLWTSSCGFQSQPIESRSHKFLLISLYIPNPPISCHDIRKLLTRWGEILLRKQHVDILTQRFTVNPWLGMVRLGLVQEKIRRELKNRRKKIRT